MDEKIQWYPGHIAKGKSEILTIVKDVDFLIEILDSRAPISSKQDEYLSKYLASKKLILVLNKSDLVDENEIKKYSKSLAKDNCFCIPFSSFKNEDTLALFNLINSVAKNVQEKYEKKGIKNKIVRGLIFGIPNVGKSTLINRLIRKKHLIAKNQPGVTRKLNEVKINEHLILFDSAGILPTKFDDQKIAKNLCLLNCISSKVFSYEILSKYLFDYLKHNYLKLLEKYCGTSLSDELQLQKIISKKRNLNSSNNLSYDQSRLIFIKDFQDGKIGKISLEK